MSDEVQERKRRLAELKEKAKKKKGEGEDITEKGEGEGAQVTFRNYQPFDSALSVSTASASDNSKDTTVVGNASELSIIQRELEEFKNKDIVVAPKKPNWDLHAQVESRLERLKRRTQRAIVEILREKMVAQEEGK
jgi:coiled-coil domain-containing protein 12